HHVLDRDGFADFKSLFLKRELRPQALDLRPEGLKVMRCNKQRHPLRRVSIEQRAERIESLARALVFTQDFMLTVLVVAHLEYEPDFTREFVVARGLRLAQKTFSGEAFDELESILAQNSRSHAGEVAPVGAALLADADNERVAPLHRPLRNI